MLKSMFFVLAGFVISGTVLAEQVPTESQAATTAQTETTPTETTEQAAPQSTPQQTETAAMAEEQSGFSRGSVMRSIFTNAIEDREPTDNMKSTGNTSNKVIYFTELRDMSGQMAKHRWEHNGNVMAEVEFNVRGPRWRVWSSKSFMPSWEGEWKVSVLNAAGEVISEELINYTQPEAVAGPENTDLTEPATTDSPQQ